MQRVVVQAVQLDVVPHIAPSPISQGIALDQAALRLFTGVEQEHPGARFGLLLTQPGHPGFVPLQGFAQRLHLADAAASFAQRQAAVHRIHTIGAHKAQDGIGVWPNHLNGHHCLSLHAFQELQRFLVQGAGFQYKSWDVQVQALNQVADHDILCAQARGLDEGLVAGRGVTQGLLCRRQYFGKNSARLGVTGQGRSLLTYRNSAGHGGQSKC